MNGIKKTIEALKRAVGIDADTRVDSTREHDNSTWFGTYLSEDEIVANIVQRIKMEPDGIRIWLDPDSWRMPAMGMDFDGVDGMEVSAPAKPHAGSLMFVGMAVRNYYGLWHSECPITYNVGPDLKIEDGIIVDDRHADNLSGRIIDRVTRALRMLEC